MSTAAQSSASRANALLSTGPRTAEGKQTSRLNALRHGATSQTLILPGEDPAEYERAKSALMHDLRPATEGETLQAERVAENWWRLQRMYKVETSLLANRMEEFGAAGPEDLAVLFTDPKEMQRMRLFLRYLSAAERAYNKSLSDFRAMQKENRKQQAADSRDDIGRAWAESLDDADAAPAPQPAGFVSQLAQTAVQTAVQPAVQIPSPAPQPLEL
jgi:hypothetical protein